MGTQPNAQGARPARADGRPHRMEPEATDPRGRIVEGVARTLALLTAADAIEDPAQWGYVDDDGAGSAEGLDTFRASMGGDWDDTIPNGFPPEALDKARAIVDDFERLNGRKVDDIGAEWDTLRADPEDPVAEFEWSDDGPERFGHCLGMQTLGHGVGLNDDIPGRAKWPNGEPKTGHAEFYPWDFDLRAFLGLDN